MEWFSLGGDSFGSSCDEIFESHHADGGFCPFIAALQTGEPQSTTMESFDGQGVWHCYLLAVRPVEYGSTRLLALVFDMTEQRRRTEQVQLIGTLTRKLEGILDLDRLLRLTLTCVTAGHGLGFNRAFIFLLDDRKKKLVGKMAVGPPSAEEAGRIWREISQQGRTLEELFAVQDQATGDRALTEAVCVLEVPLTETRNVLVETLNSRAPAIVRNAKTNASVGPALSKALDLEEFLCVPLIAHDEPLGVVLADNKFTRTAIDAHQVELVRMFSTHAALALANARAFRQITDQVKETRKAQHALIEAERFASVGRMASHLAHEIRNPLTAIGGFAKAIERAAGKDERLRRHAAIIYDEVIRLEHTLANVLDFIRPFQPEKKPIDLNSLLTQTLEQFRNVVRENEIELKCNLQPGLPPVNADPRLIKQVIINLLKNSIEALEDREQRVILINSEVSEEGEVVITVSDSGVGMDESTKQTLFAPFFTTKMGGTGVGLCISQKIVVEHGGRIVVDSELGKGSTFRIILPREELRAEG
jgi:hypothetical protein